MKHYTIGEIFRLQLVKNMKGQPYKDKASLSVALRKNGVKFKEQMTPYGIAKTVSEEDIARFRDAYVV